MGLNVLSVFVIFILQKRSCITVDGNSTFSHIHLCKIPALSADNEARAFWDSIKKRRGKIVLFTEFLHHVFISNVEYSDLSLWYSAMLHLAALNPKQMVIKADDLQCDFCS